MSASHHSVPADDSRFPNLFSLPRPSPSRRGGFAYSAIALYNRHLCADAHGAIAQLVARLLRMEKVGGSIPPSSTTACWRRFGPAGFCFPASPFPVSPSRFTADFPWDGRRRVPDVLARHGYRVLSPDVGQRTMPDGLAAETLLGGRNEDEPYVAHTIFDAWFHWMD